MRNKINFITGESYTLAELFSGNRKIIVPDLQRDYCWGDSIHTDERKELVSGFVENLIDQFANSKATDDLNLGLIYGYESPENQIQLCDGQQRLTTLFLLIGMLNKHAKGNPFRRQLISDYEFLMDDKEPYLLYSVRESSLYFMSDLVCHFFITDDKDKYFAVDVDEIKEAQWYFNDYRNDPSVQSMLKALKVIEDIIKDKDRDWHLDFGMFLLHRLQLLYYDLDSRENGEETFVVINTTGEPLTASQNLKPLVCGHVVNKDYDGEDSITEDWEKIESWFWKKRIEDNGNDTADAGFNEFLRWITILNSPEADAKKILKEGKYTFPIEKIPFSQIFNYWKIVKFLFEDWDNKGNLAPYFLSPKDDKEINGLRCIKQIDCLKLLPVIAYCKTWGIPQPNDRNLFRLYKFLENTCRIDNATKAVNDLVVDAIRIAETCKDIIELPDTGMKISGTLFSKEEARKLEILSHTDNPQVREEIEQTFWNAQDTTSDSVHGISGQKSHWIWSGEIMPLIEWSTDDTGFDIKKFQDYLNAFNSTFIGDGDAQIDEVRRALLTRNLKDYPRIFRGNTVYSFGWEWSDWQILFDDNKEAFKSFFDDIISGKTLKDMICAADPNKDWAEFVVEPRLMKYCQQKNLQWHHNAWYLMRKQRFSSDHANVHAYKYYLSHKDRKDIPREWQMNFYEDGNTCVYFEKNPAKKPYICIDAIWNAGNSHDEVEMDLFMKPNNDPKVLEESRFSLEKVAVAHGFQWIRNRYRKWLKPANLDQASFTAVDVELSALFAEL